ncbi:efflux RND transporter permease subunit [Aliamphritea spongicola]|uniref:efflux RND transporter permease subunit n=1 Tax=Aliamphritea spongicola TaxID=707589 RepID=UPI00196B03CA|nr:efflux RND transporter permease subunit [Aliamphritea spongicola]MBN3563007.1 efflux RND transporter permease subunit [Aliamphritea spongicola]
MNASVSASKGWVAWFTRNPVAANLLMVFILVIGSLTAMNLRVEDFPSLPPNSISVTVSYDSGSALTSEEGVTIKLEEALNGVPGIKQISSTSDGSGSTLTVEQTSGYNLDTLYQDVKNRIDSITTLPDQAETPVVSRQLDIEDALSVHIYGSADQQTLQNTAKRLRDQLLANPFIEEVVTGGRQTPEITIQADEQLLQSMGLSLNDIATRIAAASVTESGGELYSENGTLIVKADQPKYFQREFANILISETRDGQRITLGDVARVSDSYAQSGIIARYNGQPAVELAVQMYGSSDIMQISENVKTEVAAFQSQLPANVHTSVWNDSSVYITERLGLLLNNSLMGIALVMLMLSLLLNVRVAFWVGAGLPVIFAGAMLLLGPNFYNLSLNEITTFGFIIALGIVVDDAVVVGESIYAERERHGASIESTIRGAQRVTVPTVFGVLTTVAAFMALSLVEGRLGKIFAMFAYAAAFCLIFSLIESKLILPAHLANLRMHSSGGKNPLARSWRWLQSKISQGLNYWIRHLYRPFIHQALKLRYATLLLAITIFILVIGMILSGQIRSVFFPDIPENTIQVSLTLEDEAGYGLVQSQALEIEQAGQLISQQLQDEFQLDMAPIQSLALLTTDTGATLTAELSPLSSRPFSTNLIAERWEAATPALEAVRRLRFITDHEDEADISIDLRATDSATLQTASRQVQQALSNYAGVSGVQNSMKAGQPQIDLQLRPEGQAMGLTTAMLAQQIQQAYQGYEVQRIQRGKDEVKVRVRYPDEQRRSADDLNRAHIRTPEGQAVPLLAVADISSGYVAREIERIDRSRVAVITADLNKQVADANDILAALESELFQQLRLDNPGLSIVLSGEAQEEAESTGSLVIAFAVALLAIYALLAIPLKSYTQPLLIMTAIPFGIIGALLGLWLHGLSLSILAMFGILALSGVVVNDSLLLISRFNENRSLGKGVKLAMIEACCGRMRAIILTSVTTYVGLVPLILDTSESAQILIPAAVAMGYGILFATMITLILIPALVMISEDFRFSQTGKNKAEQPLPTHPQIAETSL